MLTRSTMCLLLGLGFLVWGAPIDAQTEQPASTRKIVTRVVPMYPPLAKPLHLSGRVKFEALVAQDGTVKTISVKGGNAVFVQAAESALQVWKWEKSSQPTTEVIEFNFTP